MRALLRRLVRRAGMTVRDLLREKGTPYAELDLVDPSLTDDALLAKVKAHPIPMNRPLVVNQGVRLCSHSTRAGHLQPQTVVWIVNRAQDRYERGACARSTLKPAAREA